MSMSDSGFLQDLRGSWRLLHDPTNEGKAAGWYDTAPTAARPVPVPGIVQQVYPDTHGVFWYWHTFIPLRAPEAGEAASVWRPKVIRALPRTRAADGHRPSPIACVRVTQAPVVGRTAKGGPQGVDDRREMAAISRACNHRRRALRGGDVLVVKPPG